MSINETGYSPSAAEFPHSIEAEQSVIGAVIADPSIISVVLQKV